MHTFSQPRQIGATATEMNARNDKRFSQFVHENALVLIKCVGDAVEVVLNKTSVAACVETS